MDNQQLLAHDSEKVNQCWQELIWEWLISGSSTTIMTHFFINLLNWANIKRPFTTSLDGRVSNQVEVRLQDTKDGYLVFIINHR